MAESSESAKLLAYLKKVSADLYQARERLRKMEAAEQEPVAVIGMGCRFPGGVPDPDGPWGLGFPRRSGRRLRPLGGVHRRHRRVRRRVLRHQPARGPGHRPAAADPARSLL